MQMNSEGSCLTVWVSDLRRIVRVLGGYWDSLNNGSARSENTYWNQALLLVLCILSSSRLFGAPGAHGGWWNVSRLLFMDLGERSGILLFSEKSIVSTATRDCLLILVTSWDVLRSVKVRLWNTHWKCIVLYRKPVYGFPVGESWIFLSRQILWVKN